MNKELLSCGLGRVREYQEKGQCPACLGMIIGFKDEVSVREWELSGLCQSCQNQVFGDDEGN